MATATANNSFNEERSWRSYFKLTRVLIFSVVFIIADYPSISLAGLPEIAEVWRQSDRRRADFLGRALLRGLLAHRGSIVLIFFF